MSSNNRALFNEAGVLKLRDIGEWRPLLLTEATGSRTTRQTDGTVVIESLSVSGDVNTVNINSGSAKLGGGSGTTQNNAGSFTFPLLKQDGTSYKLNEQFDVDIFMEWTDTPGATNNNTCFFAACLTDGNTDFASAGEQGLFGSIVIWNNASGPKVGTVSRGGGMTLTSADSALTYLRASISTTENGTDYPVYRVWTDGYDSGGDIEQSRTTTGTGQWGGSMSSRPTVDAAIAVGIGRHTAKGANSEFDIRIYYRISPVLSYQGSSTLRPGT
jgi:hypothetical protein